MWGRFRSPYHSLSFYPQGCTTDIMMWPLTAWESRVKLEQFAINQQFYCLFLSSMFHQTSQNICFGCSCSMLFCDWLEAMRPVTWLAEGVNRHAHWSIFTFTAGGDAHTVRTRSLDFTGISFQSGPGIDPQPDWYRLAETHVHENHDHGQRHGPGPSAAGILE